MSDFKFRALRGQLVQPFALVRLILQLLFISGYILTRLFANSTPSEGIACTNIAAIDFRNIELESGNRAFHFRNGEAYNFDAPSDLPAEQKPDWKSTIIGDTTVHPAPGVAVRFLAIESEHLTGSGSILYVLGFRCIGTGSKQSTYSHTPLPGHLEKVFERSGASLKVEKLDNTNVEIGMMPYYGKSVVKHWSYEWTEAAHRYVTKSVWLRHLTSDWLAIPQFRN